MPKQDFFAFCTSLKPVELKAIGMLSRVEHLAAAETVYRASEPGDRLYIVNRGVVEIVDESAERGGCGTYLSRGDIFGEVEAFTGEPRRNGARTCEAVSLQCFDAKDFPELLQRVPAFFRFLCDQLASRLAHAPAAAPARVECLELSGSFANFDLVTIYQTIVNSSQTGELSIRNDTADVIITFYFESGQPLTGTFDHLIGEEAFWQLFVAERTGGSFSFSAGARSAEARAEPPQLTRPPGEMLIHALQRRDEFHTLERELTNPGALLERQKPHLAAEQIAGPALLPVIEQIWRFADKRRVTLRSLYPRFDVCELKIYQAVAALVRSGHFTLSSDEVAEKVA